MARRRKTDPSQLDLFAGHEESGRDPARPWRAVSEDGGDAAVLIAVQAFLQRLWRQESGSDLNASPNHSTDDPL